MTAGSELVRILRPVLGAALAERIRINLPSRKPQLWERLPRALRRRLEIAVRARVDPGWFERPVPVTLPDLDIALEVVPGNAFIDGFVYVFGIYEVSGTKLLQEVLAPGMTVADVGANGGYYTVLAARLVGPSGRVYAFEPVPHLAEKLARNVALNGMAQVELRRQAVADVSGEISLYESRCDNNDGMGSLLPGPGRRPEPRLVPVVRLGDVARALGRPLDLVKIDVEGAEERVLAGAAELLARRDAPALLFESYAPEEIAAGLRRQGYEVRRVHYTLGSGLELRAVGEPFDDVFPYEGPNYFALKPGSRFPSFEEIAARSRRRVAPFLRWLGRTL